MDKYVTTFIARKHLDQEQAKMRKMLAALGMAGSPRHNEMH